MSYDKCYIAGKITGLPKKEYTALFEKAEQEVKKLGYKPVSPIKLRHGHRKEWSDYLSEDIRTMLTCDAVFALANWGDSKGARIEIELADKLGMKIIYQTITIKVSGSIK